MLIRHINLTRRVRLRLLAAGAFFVLLAVGLFLTGYLKADSGAVPAAWQPGDLIKWVDFDIPCEVMEKALKLDVASHAKLDAGEEDAVALDWVELLSYLAAKYWGDFDRFRDKDLAALVSVLQDGQSMDALTKDMKLFPYYRETYTAVLGGLVGPYRIGAKSGEEDGWQDKYGLKAFSPVASGYPFSHYDDFGVSRSYGYKRRHLGHDMMAQVGTPVIAVETGLVEELGWNQYGGWRVGIRSLDGKRYYYYAHFRKNRPYREGLAKGQIVYAGDVIGYVGRTGYSPNENVNNIRQSHLHWGLQIIFDESQKEGPSEIWINVFEITKLLQKNRSKVLRNAETKEFSRAVPFEEPIPDARTGGGETPETTVLPIIMYHSLLNDRAGENPYIITPKQFEADLRYLRQNGFSTVVVSDLIQFIDTGQPLPDKPVMLTFDDGYYNNVHYGQPLLEQYGMKAVLAVVGEYVDKSTAEGQQNPNFSYASWDTLRQVAEDGVFDIQSHTDQLHKRSSRKGCLRLSGESLEDYRTLLSIDADSLAQKLRAATGQTPTALIYPFGAVNGESEQVWRGLGFRASMTSRYGVNTLTPGDPDCLFGLRRNLRSSTVSLQAILLKYGV